MASPLPGQPAADNNNTSGISPAPEEPVGSPVENNVPRRPLEREADERTVDRRRALIDWMGADLDEIENTASASKDRVKSRRRYVTALEGLKSAVEIRQPTSLPNLPDSATLSVTDVAESLEARIDEILRDRREESTFIKRARIVVKKVFFGSSFATNVLLIPTPWTPLSARVKLSSILTV
jgi:hypothetical protein